jgi:hypothetical protein
VFIGLNAKALSFDCQLFVAGGAGKIMKRYVSELNSSQEEIFLGGEF